MRSRDPRFSGPRNVRYSLHAASTLASPVSRFAFDSGIAMKFGKSRTSLGPRGLGTSIGVSTPPALKRRKACER